MTYKVVRLYFPADPSPQRFRVVKRGLTLEEAQAHCQNPETSSSTATRAAARRRTRLHGPWALIERGVIRGERE